MPHRAGVEGPSHKPFSAPCATMLPLIFGAKNVRENVGPFDFLARLLTWPQLGWRLHELSFRITEVSAVPPTRFVGAFVRPFVGDSAATFASLPPIGIPPQKVTDLLFHHVAESRAFLGGPRGRHRRTVCPVRCPTRIQSRRAADSPNPRLLWPEAPARSVPDPAWSRRLDQLAHDFQTDRGQDDRRLTQA
jgi:hypothetical protein